MPNVFRSVERLEDSAELVYSHVHFENLRPYLLDNAYLSKTYLSGSAMVLLVKKDSMLG